MIQPGANIDPPARRAEDARSVAARAKSKRAPRSLAPKLGCRMLPTCPLPRPELSAADWQAYFQRLYGRSGGSNLTRTHTRTRARTCTEPGP